MAGNIGVLVTSLLLIACRSPGEANDAAATTLARQQAPAKILREKSGKLTGLRSRTGPSGKPVTEALLTYELACGETLEAFSSAVMRSSHGVKIYAAALASAESMAADPGYPCTGTPPKIVKTVDLDVAARDGDVDVVNLHLAPGEVPFHMPTGGLEPLTKGSITKIEPLCPGSPETCPKNGTFATVALTGSCSLRDGPSGYFIEPKGHDMFTLIVAGFRLADSSKSGCSAMAPQTLELFIPMQSLPAEALSLVVLK